MIEIKNAKKLKCPNCNSIFAFKNEKEILYRNISILYSDKENKVIKCRCKQCKKLITQKEVDGCYVLIE